MDKIELSENKIVPGALTVWNEHGVADLTMNLKALSFRPESLSEIYAFHVLDHLFPEETGAALKSWFGCLKSGGKIFVVVDDFEYIARGFVGGDLSIELVNQVHNHPTQFTQDNLTKILQAAGFRDVVVWYGGLPDIYNKKHYELVLAAIK
jgi:predicted SAM-dependent methyltransferase